MHDRTLIKQVLQGQEHACLILVERHQQLVLHIVGRMLQQTQDTEDVCQEVFIKVFRQLKTFKQQSKLSTWIASIAYRTALNHLRHTKQTRHIQYEIEQHVAQCTHHKTPLHQMENTEIKTFIMREIEHLPLQYRNLITLYHLHDFSYKEIEQITNIKMGTIKSYLARARQILRNKLNNLK